MIQTIEDLTKQYSRIDRKQNPCNLTGVLKPSALPPFHWWNSPEVINATLQFSPRPNPERLEVSSPTETHHDRLLSQAKLALYPRQNQENDQFLPLHEFIAGAILAKKAHRHIRHVPNSYHDPDIPG
jgi:hypothetical protein